MNTSLQDILTPLGVDPIPASDLARIAELQKQWLHWDKKADHYRNTTAEPEFQQARADFLENPTPATEQRLLVLADTTLTMRRYCVLHRAIRELQSRLTAQAAAILQPHLDRARSALDAEYSRRYEKAEPVWSNKKNHPTVRECKRWMDEADTVGQRIFRAADGNSEQSPESLLEGWVRKLGSCQSEKSA
jgi:hypothetical protein